MYRLYSPVRLSEDKQRLEPVKMNINDVVRQQQSLPLSAPEIKTEKTKKEVASDENINWIYALSVLALLTLSHATNQN